MRPHSLLFLSCTVLWTLLPIQAGAKSAKGKGQAMTQRILFHPAPTTDWVRGLQVETLGRIPKGSWMAVDDASALELLKRDKSTLMLFPTREEYQEAMEGLDEAQTAKAVAMRQAVNAADPKSFSLPDYTEAVMSRLSASAAGSDEPGGAGQAMRASFDRELDLLVLMSGGNGEWGAGAVTLFSSSYDPLNELNWEEEALRKHVGDRLPPLDSALEGSRRDLALRLQQGMKRHGAKIDQEPTGRSWAGLERGIFVTPMDERLVSGIRSSHEAALEWKDGFVCAWKESGFGILPMKEKKKQILYFDAGVFRAEHGGLTVSQLRIRFARRAAQPLEADAREYLARLKLDAVLDLAGKLKPAARFDKPLADLMSRHLEAEKQGLRKLLSAYPIWRKSQKPSLEQIKAESAAALKDLEFWNAWAARNSWHLEQEQVEGFISAMRKP